jgi:hypothetical protein
MSARHQNREPMWEIVGLCEKCCGTIMIFCGSDSEFYIGKVLVPVLPPVSVPAPVPEPDLDLFRTVFNNKKFVQNFAFSMLKAALFPKKFASKMVIFFTFDYILCWI